MEAMRKPRLKFFPLVSAMQIICYQSRAKNSEKEKEIASTSTAHPVPNDVQELIAPNPLSSKVEFYSKITTEFFESCYGLIPPLQFKEYVPSQRIKRLKLKTLAEQSLLKANKLLDEHSKDGKAINWAKLSKELKDCNPGDVRREENIKELIEERSNGLIAAKEGIEQSRSKLFEEFDHLQSVASQKTGKCYIGNGFCICSIS